jgi:hypothetical protein
MIAAGDGAGKIGNGLPPNGPGADLDSGAEEWVPVSELHDALARTHSAPGGDGPNGPLDPGDKVKVIPLRWESDDEPQNVAIGLYGIVPEPYRPERQAVGGRNETLLPARLLDPGLDARLHPDILKYGRFSFRARTVLAGWRTSGRDLLTVRSAGGSEIQYLIRRHPAYVKSDAREIVLIGDRDALTLFVQLLARRANVAAWPREEIADDIWNPDYAGGWIARRIPDSDLFLFAMWNGHHIAIWWNRITNEGLSQEDAELASFGSRWMGKDKARGIFGTPADIPRSQMDDTAFQLALRDFRADTTPPRGTPSPAPTSGSPDTSNGPTAPAGGGAASGSPGTQTQGHATASRIAGYRQSREVPTGSSSVAVSAAVAQAPQAGALMLVTPQTPLQRMLAAAALGVPPVVKLPSPAAI